MTIRISCFLSALLFWATVPQALALTNQLQEHPAPYLAQHGEDPVAWQEWSDAVFELARAENKLVYVSVGYFSCHWCHVMQEESYRDPEIAEVLNRDFIPVKVDRELQPALDIGLMDFVQKTQGRGGWPLNAFLTPEGYPLYAVLYVPPDSFAEVIKKIQTLWQQDPVRIATVARQTGPSGFEDQVTEFESLQVATLGRAFEQTALSIADLMEGGFGNQSRFPYFPQLTYLLRRYQQSPSGAVRELLQTTLDAISMRGLHDHVEGGFFRYTVDPGWSQPHFEKMLYDNAQLARLYLLAAVVLDREDYRATAFRTLDFMMTKMRTAEGFFAASLSAVDGQGREGAYYLYDEQALSELLTFDEGRVIKAIWSLPAFPAFEYGHLLINQAPVESVATQLGLSPDEINLTLNSAMSKLRSARASRTLPVDHKPLAGWNALALMAFLEGAKHSTDRQYTETAEKIKKDIVATLWRDGKLQRSQSDRRSLGTASLADYAYVAQAFFEFWDWSNDPDDLDFSYQLVRASWQNYHHANGWRREVNSLLKGAELSEMLRDETLFAPDAVLIMLSFKLADLKDDPELAIRAAAALNRGFDKVLKDAFFYPTRIRAMEDMLSVKF